MKVMRKLTGFLLISTLLLTTFYIDIPQASAKTLGDLKKELDVLSKQLEENKHEQELNKSEVEKTKQEVTNISVTIENTRIEIEQTEIEIEELNEQIVLKEQEIKEFIKYYQLSNGEPAYLEYVFGASDYTDFIYRLAITEQLTKYNNELVNEYNAKIKQNEEKTKALAIKQENLKSEQEKLSKKITNLGNEMTSILDDAIDLEESIKMQREAINYYQNVLKCSDKEDIATCGRGSLPADTQFYRPIISGYVTSEFGQRSFDYHYGIDLSTTENNAPVYAAAAGVVIYVGYRTSCGGNKVYVHHNINGKTYTTSYVHLRAIHVTKGQTVTLNTQIGIMGGDPRVEYWDKCSTGRHLHFSITEGLYLKDYYSGSLYYAKSMNPRKFVNFPAGRYNWFTNRTTKY